jgi:hypothetical protein
MVLVTETSWGTCVTGDAVQVALTAAFSAAFAKVPLVFWPRVMTAAMHTTMMSANITAYSTAVGPSSLFKKFTKC